MSPEQNHTNDDHLCTNMFWTADWANAKPSIHMIQQWGTVDAEMKASSAEKPELYQYQSNKWFPL